MAIDKTDLRRRIQRLADIEAIKQLMHRYARACDDEYKLDGLMALFTDDIVMEFGEAVGDFYGWEATETFWASAPTINLRPLHYMMSPIITVAEDGLSARGDILLWEETQQYHPVSGELEAVWCAGRYDNEFRKIDGAWKISRIALEFEVLCSYEEGWGKQRVRKVAM